MFTRKTGGRAPWLPWVVLILSVCRGFPAEVSAGDLEAIRARGVLRHLGTPYANFVREAGPSPDGPVGADSVEGLDVELIQMFAEHIGVRYQLVRTTWAEAFADLTGRRCPPDGTAGAGPRGDIIAGGLTILPCRKAVVDFSIPTFQTGVWLAARADSTLRPILPSGRISRDVIATRAMLRNRSVLAMRGTSLDPSLYDLEKTGARILLFPEHDHLDGLAPAIIQGAAETALLDIPGALVALQKWPGDIKIIGPITGRQFMGAAFRKNSPELLAAFNRFFEQIWKDGTYRTLVRKYYPSIFLYLEDFFSRESPL